MKRRAISFITVLVLCLSLCPTGVLTDVYSLDIWDYPDEDTIMTDGVWDEEEPYKITKSIRYDTAGHSFTATKASAMRVMSTGKLYLTHGTIESKSGAGVEVMSGGFLSVTNPGMNVSGTTYGLDIESGATVQISGGTFTGGTYGLDIASGADVQLSGGTFIGGQAAIQAGNYSALRATGYAFFDDENGDPIKLTEVSGNAKKLVVKECTNHKYSYAPISGTPTHKGTCVYCGTEDAVAPCRFNFNADGVGVCEDCGRQIEITITIDRDLIYDGENHPSDNDIAVTVKLRDGGTELEKGSDKDYTVTYTPSVNAGEDIIIVTVTGKITVGDKTSTWTFEKSFNVTKATPEITWDHSVPNLIEVPYNPDKGAMVSAVKDALVDKVIITKIAARDEEDLKKLLDFSYERTNDGKGDSVSETGKGLPTEAGTYVITARLPELDNYEASDPSGPITLKINRISPIENAPEAVKPIYNRYPQELVTPGSVQPGAEIQFALEKEDGSLSWGTEIPEATNAGGYNVYYKVEGTNNYTEVSETPIPATIQKRPTTPHVILGETSFVYDNSEKRPSVTLKDPTDDNWEIFYTEYEMTYENNIAVSTDDKPAKVIIDPAEDGNYTFDRIELTFTIFPANQAGLTITGQPDKVEYGDVFTLGTVGGSSNEAVTWEITDGKDVVAKIADSGQVTVIGLGSFTVQATRPGGGNLEDATNEVSFDAGPRHVTATVTAASKTYDGTDTAEVTAIVEPDDLVTINGVTDEIKIEGLSGQFSDENVGTGKAVKVSEGTNFKMTVPTFAVGGEGKEKYVVTIPTAPVTADITRATASITMPTDNDNSRTYDGTARDLLKAGASVSVAAGVTAEAEYALSESGTYSTVIPQATNAGSYEVWYRVRETANYTGPAADKIDVTISPKSVTAHVTLIPDPEPATDDGNETYDAFYYYDGAKKEPEVKVTYTEAGEGDTSGPTVTIPPGEYDVTYKDNVNVGTATVTVKAKENGNYTFDNTDENGNVNGIAAATFTIVKGDNKAVLTSSPLARDLTYNGAEQELVTVGTAAGGHLEYGFEIEDQDGAKSVDYKTSIPKKKDAGTYIVYYKVVGDGNHEDSVDYSVSVTIKPKTVNLPVIELDTSKVYTYDGTEQTPEVVSVKENNGVTVIWEKDINDVNSRADDEFSITYSNNVNAGKEAAVHIASKKDGNYIVSGSATFEIKKATAGFSQAPAKMEDELPYKAKAQPLITAGIPNGGTALYWLDGEEDSASAGVPTGTDRGSYKVHAKVQGDSNHEDSDEITPIEVTIGPNAVKSPTITVSRDQFTYNGTQQKPDITVWDDEGCLIPDTEYEVEIKGQKEDSELNLYSDVDTYNITIKTLSTGNPNYTFENGKYTQEGAYQILEADQTAISITGMPVYVYYGDEIQLSLTGGTDEGTVEWEIKYANGDDTENRFAKNPNGLLIIEEVGGPYIITATRTSTSGNYQTISTTYGEFYTNLKPVKAVVTVKDKDYDGTTVADLESITVPGTDISFDDYENIKGTFANKNVGTNIPVSFTITDDLLTITNGDNYVITYPSTATASIKPAAVKVAGTVTDDDPMAEGNHPTAADPEYNGSARELVAPGKNLDGGVWVYSLDGVSYSQVLPEAVKAGDYTVWYKVLADSNYEYDREPEELSATIRKKPVSVTVKCSPETFPYDGTEKTPNVIVTYTEGSEVEEIPASNYTVEFPKERTAANTPENENYKVTVTAKENGNYEFTNSAEGTFKIVLAEQAPLSIVTTRPSTVYFGDLFGLSAVGGSGRGDVVWEIVGEKDENGGEAAPGSIATINPKVGMNVDVTVNGIGSFNVTAHREKTEGSYKESDEVSMMFTARRKQVTAVVTAQDKVYDGSKDAAVSVTVLGVSVEDTSDDQDAITGEFLDADAGTNKTVKVEYNFDNVRFPNDDKYDVTWPEKTTASINPADVKVEDPVGTIRKMTDNDYPTGNSLTYSSGSEQLLLTKGTKLVGGFWAYSTDRVIYSQDIPKGNDAGEYEVWCTVIPDKNYKYDADPKLVTATIGKADQDELKILEPSSSTYYYGDQFALKASGGSGSGAVSWSWEDSDALTFDPNTGRVTVAAASRNVTITATKAGDQNYNQISSNFSFDTQKKPITAVIEVKDVRYDEVGQDKKATITSVTWVDSDGKPVSVDDDNLKDIKSSLSAEFDEVAVGPRKVTILWTGSQSMSDISDKYDITIPPETTASILPAELNQPDITVDAIENLTYNGGGQELIDVSGDGSVTLVYAVYSVDDGKYWVAGQYEDVEKYESSIPTAKDAGTYKVYYKVENDNNSVGSVEVKIAKATPVIDQYPEATPIKKGDMLSNDGLVGGKAVYTDYSGQKQDIPGIFTWNPVQKPLLDNYACPVLFTPHDTKNFETKSLTATVHFIKEETSGSTTNSTNNSNSTNSSYSSDDSSSSDTSGSTNTSQSTSKPGTGSVSMQTTVQDKTASTVLDSAAGSLLVSEAVANKSANVIIKPEITGDVSKTEVSIPASAISRIGSETDAALTVSTPVADVTIPNASLDTFSGADRTVSVVTERVENTVVLTLNADGKDIGDIPGGLTLTVSAEDAGPGTVAVLIHEDGTREIIRRSVAEDGSVRIPLNGSATVEIVDNSKKFADVPAESWAADAVAFASAHEILNGTGEATFSPEISMSRAMLATVLYNLEGCPDQGLTSVFSDVDSDAWYAAGISWAAANGITSGYGDGQYGPNDDITREQLAVMLWRYMESPAADKQAPDFTDTDQASSYAMEALYWATANGILNGYGNGQLDPSGLATRAQAAQMLKNFIENT